MNNINPATLQHMDLQTIWKAGRKDKIIAAHDAYLTYTAQDLQNGEDPLAVSRRSAGIRLCISSDGTQVSGNIEHASFADIAMQWRALIPQLLISTTQGSVDVTLEKARFIPGHQMKGKSAKEIAELLSPEELSSVINALNCSTQFQENNRRFAGILTLAQNAKRAENLSFADGTTFADVLLDGTDNQHLSDQKFPLFQYLRDLAGRDSRFLSVLEARKNGVSDNEVTYTLYDRTKTPGKAPRPDGKVKVYTLSIKVTPGTEMPVTVFIENAYGIPAANGGVGIVGGTKVDALSKSFSLTREEFSGFVDAAENLILMKRMKYALWDGVLQLNESLRATQKNMRNTQTQIA